jgi:hypothetical protein
MRTRTSDDQGVDLQPWGTVTQEDIRETQRKWLAYRDAWTAFGQRLFPRLPAETWKVWLTRERTKMLEGFAAPAQAPAAEPTAVPEMDIAPEPKAAPSADRAAPDAEPQANGPSPWVPPEPDPADF